MYEQTERVEHEYALENWKRVRTLWYWMGRQEPDTQILRLLERYTVGAPLSALQRAMHGHRQGAGVLRRKSAEAIVAPLLALPYPGQERAKIRLGSYEGPAPRALLNHLRGLGDDQHFELAEAWVAYLRRARDEAPQLWQATAATPKTPPPTAATLPTEFDLAMIELRLARIEIAGERLLRLQSASAGEHEQRELHARRSAWLQERRALLEEYQRVRQMLAISDVA